MNPAPRSLAIFFVSVFCWQTTTYCEDFPDRPPYVDKTESLGVIVTSSKDHGIDEAARFIFFSVIEGLYEDGLSNEDVDQILLKKDQGSNFCHFIYACPICTATIWGLQAYRSRPDRLYSLKSSQSTFGPGLSGPLHRQLYSEDSDDRLIAINTLVQKWIARRMDRINLSEKQRADLQAALEKKRKEGMAVLQSFRDGEHGPGFGVKQAAPAYEHLDECASCNGAVGQLMPLPAKKAP